MVQVDNKTMAQKIYVCTNLITNDTFISANLTALRRKIANQIPICKKCGFIASNNEFLCFFHSKKIVASLTEKLFHVHAGKNADLCLSSNDNHFLNLTMKQLNELFQEGLVRWVLRDNKLDKACGNGPTYDDVIISYPKQQQWSCNTIKQAGVNRQQIGQWHVSIQEPDNVDIKRDNFYID